jgi:hypothetical protein|tara:strand:- start:40 stop:216 length:177 start_codon:yes stop_codon:yes gene_type:complete
MAKTSKKTTKKRKNNKLALRPPYPAPSGTRWVHGSDGWMLHEKSDPDRRIRGLYIRKA